MLITQGLVEQHIHGAFGCDFMNCTEDELLYTAQELSKCGVTAFFPTIMTDDLNIIKKRIDVIKRAKSAQNSKSAQIAGIHLEGPFINPEKRGIHQAKYILPPEIQLYKKIEDEIIKIVTAAPEKDIDGSFIKYLRSRGVKVSAGHSLCTDLSEVNQVTHLFNAMGAFSHRGTSTSLSALMNNEIYTEIIGDSLHISDDVLRLAFKVKPLNKILLISDALPLAHCNIAETVFSGEKIYNKSGMPVNEDGTLAGSSMLLCDIVKNLADKGILTLKDAVIISSYNQLKYHSLKNNLKLYWNDDNTIEKAEYIDIENYINPL